MQARSNTSWSLIVLAAAAVLNRGPVVMAAEKVMPADARYTCPMETHPDEKDPARQGPYFSAEPGRCPWCEMKLKPVETQAWTREYRRAAAGASATAASRPAGPAPTREQPAAPPGGGTAGAGMRYACPMERHPDEKAVVDQGPYFSQAPGKCPKCGMSLKPSADLKWAAAWLAAQGAEVGYTCVVHQHVLAREAGPCPRCGRELEPFKLMYTCPDPRHAGVVKAAPGHCPMDGAALAPFRGIWLGERLAGANLPPTTQAAGAARYRCAVHPLVHSERPGSCTICARPLAAAPASGATGSQPGPPGDAAGYVCPMHPEIRSAAPGTCSICAMKLVGAAEARIPTSPPDRVLREMNHLMEHYLEVQRLLAGDSTASLDRHALGIAAAGEALMKAAAELEPGRAERARAAAEQVRTAGLKLSAERIDESRVQFVELSAGMEKLLEDFRPDRRRWPQLHVFHCPMSKGDWIQVSPEKANPYYGFKMLKCGELKTTR